MDGSPYGAPPSNGLTYENPSEVSGLSVHQLAITRSRVMVSTFSQREGKPGTGQVRRIVVWDVNTGDIVSMLWFGIIML